MKKLLMILALLLVEVMSVSAQTYYYKYLYSVDGNGAKYKDKFFGKDCYITIPNSNKVYWSDENGIKQGTFTYSFVGEDKGIRKYRRYSQSDEDVIYFNSDFSRMNWYENYPEYGIQEQTKVFERTNGPEDQKAPTQFY